MVISRSLSGSTQASSARTTQASSSTCSSTLIMPPRPSINLSARPSPVKVRAVRRGSTSRADGPACAEHKIRGSRCFGSNVDPGDVVHLVSTSVRALGGFGPLPLDRQGVTVGGGGIRRLPRDRGFLVAAGLESCLELLTGWRFDGEDLDYLGNELGFPRRDLEALAALRFTGEVRALPEGTVVFADEPVLEVTAPLPEAQLVETMLLNQVTFATTIASKAVRVRLAAPDATLIDFAARRTHGLEAASTVARSTALAGSDATSYVLAAQELGIPAAGTMAHSYVEAFTDETAAFRAFAEDFPSQTVFLVDTYGTPRGVEHAIQVARDLALSPSDVGIRLDSGDLAAEAFAAREALVAAGFADARIVASGGLDEYRIADLVAAGAPIDAYGVGTRVGVSWDAPSLDSAYKLVAYDGRPVMKLSTGKATAPGAKQVYRSTDGDYDVLALAEEPAPDAGFEPLLVTVMAAGRRTGEASGGLESARRRLRAQLTHVSPRALTLRAPRPHRVDRSGRLLAVQRSLETRLIGPPEGQPRPVRNATQESRVVSDA